MAKEVKKIATDFNMNKFTSSNRKKINNNNGSNFYDYLGPNEVEFSSSDVLVTKLDPFYDPMDYRQMIQEAEIILGVVHDDTDEELDSNSNVLYSNNAVSSQGSDQEIMFSSRTDLELLDLTQNGKNQYYFT